MSETRPSHLPAPPGGGELAPAIYDCWNSIGVIGGDRSCPELEQHVHCRNCPVYAEAGAKLLDRAVPPGYRDEWTRRLAEKKISPAEKRESVVVFRISYEWFALPTAVFQEVAERRVIRALPPRRDSFVLGLANVRGELLVCVSLRKLLGVEAGPEWKHRLAAYNRLLVTVWHGQRLAFPVEEVFGVHRFFPQEMKEKPAAGDRTTVTFVRGLLNWEDRMAGLLDAERVFSILNQNLA